MRVALAASAWVAACPTPALAIDAEDRITAVNDPLAKCLAAQPQALLATELVAMAADPVALRQFLRDGAETPGEFSLRAADGSERWLELSIGKEVLSGQRLLSAFDVTARRATYAELESETRRYRDIVGIGGGTLYEMNADLTRIRMWERDRQSGAITIRDRPNSPTRSSTRPTIRRAWPRRSGATRRASRSTT